jgi:hypothetical protein
MMPWMDTVDWAKAPVAAKAAKAATLLNIYSYSKKSLSDDLEQLFSLFNNFFVLYNFLTYAVRAHFPGRKKARRVPRAGF